MSDGQYEAARRQEALEAATSSEQAQTVYTEIARAVAEVNRANEALARIRIALSQILWCLRSEHEQSRKSGGGPNG